MQLSRILLLILALVCLHSLQAQINERDLKSDSLVQLGERTYGRAGFDTTASNGFFIRDQRKPRFSLNLGAWTTPRYNYITLYNTPDTVISTIKGFEVNRTRIYFTGKYSDQFNFTLVTNISADGVFDLQQVYLTYTINEDYIVSVGNQFVASSREDWMDPSNILAMQCSGNDAAFALGTSFGALLYRRPKNNMRWWVSISNGLYGWNREVTGSNQSDYMFGGRFEYMLSGQDWTVWDDLVGRRGRSKGILLGAAANYLRQTIGQLRDRAAQLNLDVSFNGNGYQVLIAGVWTGQFPDTISNFNQYGLFMQGGYFFNKVCQVYAYYDLVHPGNTPGDFDAYSAIGAGFNVYPFRWTNRWKFTLEYSRLFSVMSKTIVPADVSLGFVESDYYGQQTVRLQIQFGF